jgi:hypothetical protein
MLLKQSTLAGILDGSITLQFRRWKRPTVKAGGTLLTAVGQLAIDDVEPVTLEGITAAEARAAGFPDLESLLSTLERGGSGQAYRIRLSLMGPDPRVELRDRPPSEKEVEEIRARLLRLDARSETGPWTTRTLCVIRDRPAERAADLARELGMERVRFKTNVRKLKALGLTESLETGYRLSQRGRALVRGPERG